MKRIEIAPRQNWRQIAESNGFFFHHVDGAQYWDESVYYSFTLEEIENNLEEPANELHAMCLDFVDDATRDSQILSTLKIPEIFWDRIKKSWAERENASFYGRFDFSYDGNGPAKLLEYNADTPTSLYEASYFQWIWLEDQVRNGIFPEDIDQFNSIQEKLCDAMSRYAGKTVHFACVKESEEDRATVEYLMDCAIQSGIVPRFIHMEDIGRDEADEFFDLENTRIETLFKLYPWEYIWKDQFGESVANSKTRFIEPSWKMILSNKGILPYLWERHKNHPNLLEATFGVPDAQDGKIFLRKPMLSREGANISINGGKETPGAYGKEGHIWQLYHPLPNIRGNYPVCGVWIANGIACGLGIREDKTAITMDTSRFVPHIIS